MAKASRSRRYFYTFILNGLAIPFLFPVVSGAQATQEALVIGEPAYEMAVSALPAPPAADLPEQPSEAGPAEIRALSLSDCIGIALEQQPAIAAQRASLAAAQANRQALQDIHVPRFLAKDMPIRRHQASLGVRVACAGVDLAERETTYAVTRTYFSVLYARDQQQVTAKVVSELTDALANAERLLGKEGAPRDLTKNSVDKNKVYLRMAKTRKGEADQGVERAMAALREAMGVGCDFHFIVPEGPLPEPQVNVCKEEIIQLALSRRGEMTQAVTASQITCLEVEAQGTSRRPKKQTFAAVADIHANPVPQGTSDGDYRPGGIGLEMPTMLAGPRADREERAGDFSARASAVVDKTHNLIALEAEDAYLKWETASQRLAEAREAADIGDSNASNTLNDFKGGQGVPYRDVLEAVILAAQARAQYNDIRFQQVLALAALERVTGGGFCPSWEAPIPKQP